jgi:hypothetical protein
MMLVPWEEYAVEVGVDQGNSERLMESRESGE